MLRLERYKAELKAVKAQQKIQGRDFRAMARTALRTESLIKLLETKIGTILAKTKR